MSKILVVKQDVRFKANLTDDILFESNDLFLLNVNQICINENKDRYEVKGIYYFKDEDCYLIRVW